MTKNKICNKILSDFIKKGLDHSGVILSKQLPIGVIIKALLKLLSNLNYEKVKNNPVITFTWGKVEITIYAHKINGLTESDFILAAKIDSLNK